MMDMKTDLLKNNKSYPHALNEVVNGYLPLDKFVSRNASFFQCIFLFIPRYFQIVDAYIIDVQIIDTNNMKVLHAKSTSVSYIIFDRHTTNGTYWRQ